MQILFAKVLKAVSFLMYTSTLSPEVALVFEVFEVFVAYSDWFLTRR